ncbi:acyl-CoA thioesterase [Actinomadura decatromicini]|uniref:Acyl-CoA thioesterase II n=1 Tax=Actinomadura decatromicini TaxID=2604572 RepID=A0A5D3F926_9ACTN|nr:acyl-CoA thioesterase domain-containing protein [Actinomadura decatromicini]TYK44458.1 acyl-CoA thioesterase II [Actinomadura decatromicini]
MGIVADLASALDLERLDPGRYRGNSVDSPERDVVFGGQLVAQLAVAAARGEPGKRVKTVHALFARVASKAKPIDFDVEPLHSGRTMASATVTASQDGRLRARANVLLTADDEDLIRHAARMPDVEPPEALEPLTDPYAGRELRVAGGADLNGTAPGGDAGSTELAVWTRTPGASGEQAVLQGMLAHATAGFLIGAAMRPHPGLSVADAHDKFSTGILGHSVTFHEEVDPGDWILLAQESPYAGRGRSYGRGHAFARDGRLVASFAQDSIIRRFASPAGTRDGGRDRASVL